MSRGLLLSIYLFQFLPKPLDDLFFQPGDIGLGDADHVRHLLLGLFLPAPH